MGISNLFTLKSAIVVSSLFYSAGVFAGCNYIPKGGAYPWNFDFSQKFTIEQNKQGAIVPGGSKSLGGSIQLDGCTCHAAGSSSGYYQAVTNNVVDSQKFQKVNEYLSVKVDIFVGGGLGRFETVPFLVAYPNRYSCDFKSDTGGSGVNLTYRIDRPFVGVVNIPNVKVADFYSSMGVTPDIGGPVESIVRVGGSVVVPQSCVLNAGQIVNIDFGNISSGAFKTAGAKADGVNPVAKTIGIQCANIAAQANLTLRVQADNVSGNAIVSNNKDVGFVITDGNNRELTPNNVSSVISFILDDSAHSNVTIKVFPVSVTGNKPTEGVVTSLAYLRVDFA